MQRSYVQCKPYSPLKYMNKNSFPIAVLLIFFLYVSLSAQLPVLTDADFETPEQAPAAETSPEAEFEIPASNSEAPQKEKKNLTNPLRENLQNQPETEENPAEKADFLDEEPLLPEGMTEEEARWANWEDWDKVDGNDANTQTEPETQEYIAPSTEEDALEDNSSAMAEESIPDINERLDASRHQIITEPESDDIQDDSSEKTALPTEIPLNSEAIPSENSPTELEAQNAPSAESPFSDESEISDSLRTFVESQMPDSKPFSPEKINLTQRYSPQKEAPRIITDEISQLVNRIKITRRRYFEKKLYTDENSPFETLMTANAFGCYATIEHSSSKTEFNAIGALCWNYPMCETSFLAFNYSVYQGRNNPFSAVYPQGRTVSVPLCSQGSIFPLTGYCQQEKTGEFLSVLAIARVGANYAFTPHNRLDIDKIIQESESNPSAELDSALLNSSGNIRFTVADLVSDAMLNCNGGDMSALLPAMAYYAPQERWTNYWGQNWSVLRIVDNELKREVNLSDSDSTDRLYGLTYALRRRLAFKNSQLERQYIIVDEYLSRMKEFTLELQNSDGSWNGAFFTRKGKSRSEDADFAATAHFARWLMILYQSGQLDDPRLTRTMTYLVEQLDQRREAYNPSEMSQRDTRAIAYALQAIAIYQQRWAHPSHKN